MQTTKVVLIAIAMSAVGNISCGVSSTCGLALVDCGGYCADLSSDETDCGACGATCLVGDFCSGGVCIVGSCAVDSSPCIHDYDCCSDYCASDANCGCIPTTFGGCASASDCCSGNCAVDGICDP